MSTTTHSGAWYAACAIEEGTGVTASELYEILAPAVALGLVELTIGTGGQLYYRVPAGVDLKELWLAMGDPDQEGHDA